jgi:hypothetical protein
MGNTTIEIYYKVGTWNGFANTPAAWTFIGSAPVTYTGGFVPVAVQVNISIPAGQTYAFYVTSNTSAVSLNYSNGTTVGNIYSSDANIAFLEGGGMEYPFTQNTGAVYQPRVWNGNINYALTNPPTTSYAWGTGEIVPSIQPTINGQTQFTVTSTAAGCPTMYDTINVWTSVPPVSGGLNQIHCLGDVVMMVGEGAETYAWDNGVTDSLGFIPTVSGTTTYTVTGTDSIGCVEVATVDVTIYDLPIVAAGNDINSCIGDDFTLSGQGAVSYSWNNGVTDALPFEAVASNQYVVIGTGINGCTNLDTIYVTVNSLPIVDAGIDQTVCFGSPTILNGSGAQNYAWNNGVADNTPFISPAGTTTYIVIGTDVNGCINSDTIEVVSNYVPAPIQLSGATLGTALNLNGTLQWYNCDSQQNIGGENGFLYTPSVTGNYAVIVTDTVIQCSNMSDCILVDFNALSEIESATFMVYPNPTSSTITVQSSSTAINKIQVLDLVGKVIYEDSPNVLNTIIDLSQFEGKQFVVAIFSEDRVEMSKVFKY